jgi:lysophospholipase L1-like esterase
MKVVHAFLILPVVSLLLLCPATASDEGKSAEPQPWPTSAWPDPMPESLIELYFNRVAEFEKENAGLPQDATTIVFAGDSLTQGFDLEKYFPDIPGLNRGISADGIGFDERGILGRMESTFYDPQPEIIFLNIGVNDLPHPWVTVEECLAGYEKILDLLSEKLPRAKVIVHTLSPTGEKYKRHAYLNPRIEEFNEGLRNMAKRRRLPLIDLYQLVVNEEGLLPAEYNRGDGLHYNSTGYEIWAGEIRNHLD